MATKNYLSKDGVIFLWTQIKAYLGNNYVAQVAGKNLSTNDYTTAEKNKLSGIQDGANKTIINNTLTSTSTTAALSAAQGKALNDKITAINTNMENLGAGDMLKSTYDTDNNGQVDKADDADKLGGVSASSYLRNTNPNSTGTLSHNRATNSTVGDYSVALGQSSIASGKWSVAEGALSKATGQHTHAEGYWTEANGDYSHAEGFMTVAGSDYQHVQGKHNIIDETDTYAHIVGNGEGGSNLSNAHTLDWDGNAWFAGDVYIGGTGQDDTTAKKLATTDTATTSANGLMTSVMVTKLNGIATGANKYTHPSYTAKSSGLYKVTVDATGHISATTAVVKDDITALGIPSTNTTYSNATTTSSGLMSADDKTKLNGIAEGANNYTHPSYTALTGVPTANQTPKFGGTFSVSQPTTDATGHVTGLTSRTITIPSATASTSANGLMTSAMVTKLNGIDTGAEVNVIETVKVNGTALTATSKAVDITVPTNNNQLTNGAGYQTATQVNSAITSKGYQTATQVQAAITEKGYQTEAQVTALIEDVIGAAPDALNTLEELATALGEDPNFATTMATELSKKQNSADLVAITNTEIDEIVV